MFSHILSAGPLAIFCVAILAGSFTNGLAGLAFAAVSGGVVLSVLPQGSAVAVLAAGGLMLQVCNNIHYFKQVEWRRIVIYVIPGIVGIPVGNHLLSILPKVVVALVFGVVLLFYVAWTIFKKPNAENDVFGRPGEVVMGFIDGVFAGMLALPGIPVIIWANLRGYGKAKQRGLSVPINFLMLLCTMAISGLKGSYSDPETQAQLLVALPVALIGWTIGIKCFGKISELGFRRFVSGVLVLSGVVLVVPSAHTLMTKGLPHTTVAVQNKAAKSA
jgi:uncharacterized membrane protein YfcA